jgi:GNAT superfamily N-acetyltransferase
VEIIEVKTKKEKESFLRFPYDLYKDEPQWCPYFTHEMKRILYRHKSIVYDRSQSSFFLAVREGKVVGRISVGIDDILNEHKKQLHAFFAFFDCIKDAEVAKALLSTAESWSRQRKMVYLKGSISPTNGDDFRGILTEGFEYPSYFLMPFNYPYYKEYFSDWERYLDYYAFISDLRQPIPPARFEIMKRILCENLLNIEAAAITDEKRLVDVFLNDFFYREGYTIEEIDLKRKEKSAKDLYEILSKSIPDDWEEDLLPFEYEQCFQLVKDFRMTLPRSLGLLVYHNEKAVGIAVVMPNYNPIVRKIKGRLYPFGWIRLLSGKRSIKEGRAVIIFVVPEHQNRGISALLILKLRENLLKLGYGTIEFSSISAYNTQMTRLAQFIGCNRYKTYTVFGKNLLERPLSLEEIYGTGTETMRKFKKQR